MGVDSGAGGGTVDGTNVDFTNNKVTGGSVGGGFWVNEDGDVDFTNVSLTGNVANEGGGFFVSDGNYTGSTVTLTTATINNNTATVRGGGFRNASLHATVTINGGTIDGNVANNEHGGGYYNNGRVELTNVDVTNNQVLDLDNTKWTGR